MKKSIFVLFLFSLMSIGVQAQSSLTDDQVQELALALNNRGLSRQQIYQEMLKQGVTQEQLRRVYEARNGGTLASFGGAQTSSASVRKANGEQRDEEKITQQENENNIPLVYEEDDDRKIFGHDMFNNKNLTFQSSMNLATPQNYRLGPGDEVRVDIWGVSQDNLSQVISPDGYITIDGIGLIQLSGLTVSQAKVKLREEVGKRYKDSKIELTLGQSRTITVHVMGEVKVPGTYTMSAFSTVFNALYMAGGPNSIGTLRQVKVYRNGKLLSNVDVYAFLLKGALSGDVRLQDNDMITVSPYDGLVNISGMVKRPMFYEMKKDETVATLLEFAGGFTGNAHTRALRVNRSTEPNRSVFSVGEFDYSQFRLMDGDSVSVDEIINRYQNMVEVVGAVFRPGMYQLGTDISTVKALIEAAAGVKEDAIISHAVLHRMKFDRTREALSLNLQGIMDGTSPDVSLRNEDVLYVASNEAINKERTVTIHGEVMKPGIFPYAENETLEDLILQAGGPTKSASMTKIDVSRRIINPYATEGSDSITTMFTFDLNPEFKLEEETQFVLHPFDEVYVRRSPDYNIQQNVVLEGEVEFEGTYALTSKNQRLSEVVKRAGGLTKYAYVEGTKLLRQMTPDERAVTEVAIRTALRNTGTKDSIDVTKLMLSNDYPIAIELDKALQNPGTDDDPILREGDRIVVPRMTSTITVNGEVLYPNTIRYKEGKSTRYYINQAGGYTSSAKKSKTLIIYMNGMVSKASKSEGPRPGCQIIVPSKKKSNGLTMQQWLSFGTTAASLGVMVSSIANLLKK